jgi:uncharacterized membrane protein
MHGLESLLLIVGLLLLLAPVLAIIALVKASNLGYEIARLHRMMRDLQASVAQLRESAKQAPEEAPPVQPKAPPAVAEKTPPPERAIAEPPSVGEPPKPPAAEQPSTEKPYVPELPSGLPSHAPAARPPATGPFREEELAKARESLEKKLFSRGFVVIGGIAVALSVVFLVRHAMQVGWLTPVIQCSLGALLGLVLIAGGEFLRRHPPVQAAGFFKPSLVPPAMTGAGVSALFVSIYAAYALYDLLLPIAAFIALGVVWVLAMALSVLQGPFVAALGILGGYAVPILVQTGHPTAYGLFPYVLAVNGAALGVLRYKGWGWLAWGALAGAAGWPFLWLLQQPALDLGAPVIGGYLMATAALFIFTPAGLRPHQAPFTLKDMFKNIPLPAILGWTASSLMLLLALLLTWADNFGWGSVISAGLLAGFVMFAGRRDVTFDALSVGAAIMVALVLVIWDLPYWPGEVDILETLPPGLVPFVLAAVGYAGLFGIAGFWLLLGAARPGLWAGLSAGVPVITLAISFARINGFEVDLAWAAMGLVLAVLCLVAALMVSRHRGKPGMEAPLAAYAVGVVAAISLAMAMALENAWLTVTLSLQLPAIAWIHDRTRVEPLRAVAMLLGFIILGRLVLNPEIFNYALSATPGLNWMLYGYGIPTLAFYAAARMFRRHADDRLVLMLESGALVFLTLFSTMEIADIVQGGAIEPGDSLLEASLRTIAWLTISLALLYQCRAEKPRVVAVWGWQILALLSGGHIVTVHLIGLNPLLFGGDVGSWWILNLLLLGYAVPALFAVLFQLESTRQRHPSAPVIAGISALVLTFVWLSLEVRHAFHGGWLSSGYTSEAEWYAYSGVWLAYGAALLVLGIWRDSLALRNASMVVLLLSICKVFLFDMSEIGGLYRVASFLFLGLSLMLLALIYTRFVKGAGPGFRKHPPENGDQPSEP